MKAPALVLVALLLGQSADPRPPGHLVDIGGGQRIHLFCIGSGRPTVVFEGGAGDFSVIWSLVQPEVGRVARACSYDRAGYAWSDPGATPRTFAQLALELRTTLARGGERGPFLLVGQSFGGSLARGFAARYPADVAGMVLIDAVHEDGYVVWGGQPHHLRDDARPDRLEPAPRLALDSATIAWARTAKPAAAEPIEPPLDRLPAGAQRIWAWAAARPIFGRVQPREMEWSPDEAEHEFQRRRREPAPLGDIPLVVLARTRGDYQSGMRIGADSLERLRRDQQADLARLSRHGTLRFAANAGHNIHLEDPALVTRAIREVIEQIRGPAKGPHELD